MPVPVDKSPVPVSKSSEHITIPQVTCEFIYDCAIQHKWLGNIIKKYKPSLPSQNSLMNDDLE